MGGQKASGMPGFEDVHKHEFSTIGILEKCFLMIFVHILVAAWLTRARSVVVEL